MLKDRDRVEVIKSKLSWNGKRVMAKVGQKGTVISGQTTISDDSEIRIWIDGHGKGIWIRPRYLQKIPE
ncbi:hypothetical protein ACTHQ2_22760 [Bacillus subtilis]|uniref:hypothetical protein n=1 Tax=Bacillus subtilis TaxID=1423 RepID=UPI003F7CA8D7